MLETVLSNGIMHIANEPAAPIAGAAGKTWPADLDDAAGEIFTNLLPNDRHARMADFGSSLLAHHVGGYCYSLKGSDSGRSGTSKVPPANTPVWGQERHREHSHH